MKRTKTGTMATSFLPMVHSLIQFMNPDTAFSELLQFLTEKCRADCCQIIVQNSDTNKMEVRATSSQLKGQDMDFSRTILLESIEKNEPLCVANAVEDPKFQGNPSIVGKPFLSVITVPIRMNRQVIGALYLDRRQFRYGSFEKDDLQNVQTVADILTSVLIRQEESEHLRFQSELQNLGIFVGRSPKMEAVYRDIEEAAKVDLTVSIYGETGTGKELAAQALHQLSPRRQGPFIAMNCASISRDLAESELFGHEKGSFSGAIATKQGKFELAEGGTLFLDEIAELPLEIQAKLLRVIQERQLWRVGGKEAIDVNARIVIATHRNLHTETRKGTFREDLFYRLDVLTIMIPSLREREEDIPLLAYHFLDKYGQKCNKQIPGFTNDALIALRSHPWPGNVRELENTIAKAVVKQSDHQPLSAAAIFSKKPIRLSESIIKTVQVASSSLDEVLRQIESNLVRESLVRNKWKKSKTAEELKISRPRLDQLERRVVQEVLKQNNWDKSKTVEEFGISLSKLDKTIKRCKIEEKQ